MKALELLGVLAETGGAEWIALGCEYSIYAGAFLVSVGGDSDQKGGKWNYPRQLEILRLELK